MEKKRKRDTEHAALVKKTADIAGVSLDYVRKVIRMDRESEEVMNVYMTLKEGENELKAAVRKLVPFN
jgi:hypothetical protein